MIFRITCDLKSYGIQKCFDKQYEAENQAAAYELAKKDISLLSNEEMNLSENMLTIEEIIESDSDTDILEQGDGIPANGLYPYDPSYQSIEIEEQPSSIYEYLRQLNKGKIIIQPEFQRNKVWKPQQKSQFIESIILNFPLPPIYLNQNKDNKFIVIDGLQRTTALKEFFNDEFALSSLEALPVYNGLKFSMLPESLQSKLEDKKLIIFSLKPSTPLTVIYDLFKRINTGGTQLNRQEVRNCIFIGKSTRLLSELSETSEFKLATDNGISPKRMKDREVVLRYLSFRWNNPMKTYDGDMSRYLESMMKIINNMSDEEIDILRTDFKRTMSWAYELWKGLCFRIPTRHTRGIVNTAVLESVCSFISNTSDEYLQMNVNKIATNYKLLISNSDYLNSVTSATASKQNVFTRFTLATSILSN